MVALVVMTGVLTDCGGSEPEAVAPVVESTTTTTKPPRKPVKAKVKADPPVPKALFAKDLDLRAGPVPVPLQLLIPAINVKTQVLGVGVTEGDVMDAPQGPASDPVWQTAFWYRGSAIPGVISTAVIAGHINGPRGMHAVFGEVGNLRQRDLIIVRDTRTGLEVRFKVTGYTSFTLDETTQPDVLRQIYGVGPVAGTTPQRSKDGLAHLTLVTCAGTFDTGLGTHDRRLAVFATRVV